jgi:hypothetical protein
LDLDVGVDESEPKGLTIISISLAHQRRPNRTVEVHVQVQDQVQV